MPEPLKSENIKLLLLEDLQSDADIIQLQLRKYEKKIKTRHVLGKADFLKALDEDTFDVVISDYSLPQYTGMEAVKHVREHHEYLPFIICTGSVNEETAVACLKAGADDYVLKESLGRLTSAIEAAIEAKQILQEKKKAEQNLVESEENFRAIAENAPDNIYKITKEGVILYVNRDIQGLSRETLIGRNIIDLVEGNNREKLLQEFQVSFDEARQSTFEIEGDAQDNAQWYLCRIGPVLKDEKVESLIFIPSNITTRKKAELELRSMNKKLSKLTQHLENVRDEEKKKIAMEIHDQLGQELTGNKLGLFWIQQHIKQHGLAQANEEEVLEKINYLVDLTTQTIQTVRRIAHELRPVVLDDIGLIPAIEWHVENFNKNHNCSCDLIIDTGNCIFDKDLSTAIYRITQEALTNINRHAKASKSKVALYLKEDYLHLDIEDNGVGIDREAALKSKSLGIFGIHERLKAWKGEIDLNGEPGKGTKINIRIALKNIQQ